MIDVDKSEEEVLFDIEQRFVLDVEATSKLNIPEIDISKHSETV